MIEISTYVILFFAYCFVGWVWECCYVSIRKRKWVNRGFIHGPFLPIYGSGAMIIIITTYHVKDNTPLTFIIGLVSCSLLEYFTGAAMEKMFHVRYWDYSKKPLNLNGHIYWASCLLWGFASVALMEFVYPPTYEFVASFPHQIREYTAFVLTIGFTVDFTLSFRTALDFKAMLEKLTENSKAVEEIRERASKVSENMTRSTAELKERTAEMLRELEERRDKLEERAKDVLENVPKSPKEYTDRIHDKYENFVESTQEKLTNVENLIKLRASEMEEELSEEQREERKNVLDELGKLREQAKKLSKKLPSISYRQFKDAKSLILRNPTAIAPDYKEAFEELKEYLSERKNKS